eukprot:4154522-Pleurochrysis_carterae.AAC.4
MRSSSFLSLSLVVSSRFTRAARICASGLAAAAFAYSAPASFALFPMTEPSCGRTHESQTRLPSCLNSHFMVVCSPPGLPCSAVLST